MTIWIDIVCFSVFADLVTEALDSPENVDNRSSILNEILAAKDVDVRDKIVVLIDLVQAGIETVFIFFEMLKNYGKLHIIISFFKTGNATLFLLHNILSNPEVKSKVYEELDRVFSPGIEMTPQVLLELKYLRACVIESLR